MHEIGEVGNQIYLSMAYTLGNKCAKNLCKRIVLLQLIIDNVVTFFLEHNVVHSVHYISGRNNANMSWIFFKIPPGISWKSPGNLFS